MRERANRYRFATALLAWVSVAPAFAQPNLADLLDQEAPARPTAVSEAPDAPVPPALVQAGRQKEPIPAAAETKRGISAIQDIFRIEFAAANTPAKRVALAQQLLTEAKRTKKSTDRWALLVEAARLASEAGDPATTFAIVDVTTAEYAVDPVLAKLDAIRNLAPTVPVEKSSELANEGLTLCRNLIAKEQLSEAKRALLIVSTVAKRTRNRELTKEVNKLTTVLKEAEEQVRERDSVLKALATNPNDGVACLEAGRYFCFTVADWSKGLPLLAKSSDHDLAELARNELNLPVGPQALVRLGDQWRQWADSQNGVVKTSAIAHAIVLYRSVLPTVAGLDKVRIQKNIEAAENTLPKVDKIGFSIPKKIPGLQLWLDANLSVSRPAGPTGRGGAPADADGRVASWEDLSGHGHHAQQPDPALQPVVKPGAFKGDGGVMFNGNQVLEIPVKVGPVGTFVIVVTPEQVANMQPIGFRNNEQAGLHLSLFAAGGIRFEALTPTGFVGSGRQTGDYKAGKKIMIFGVWGPKLSLLVDGIAAPPSDGGVMFTRNDANWGLGSAVLPNPVVGFRGVIHTVMLFDRALVASEVVQLTQHLQAGGQ